MRGKTRAAVVVGLASTALVAASCGGGGSAPADTASGGKGGGEIKIRGCNPQNDLIPANTSETCGGDVLDLTTSKLVYYTPESGKAENDIAEKIDTTDSKTFKVTLKKGYKFSDGTEVKAKNFIDAWNYAAYGPNAQSSGSFMEPIDGYDEVSTKTATVKEMKGLKKGADDYSFDITLKSPLSDFAGRLGYTAFAPMPDAFLSNPKGDFGKKPIGAGPYKVTQWDANAQIVMEKNKDYSGKFGGQADKITYKIYQDSGAAYKDVQANNLDVTNDYPSEAIVGGRYKTDLPDRWALRTDAGVVQFVGFASPKADPAIQNPKLKQAISMAINRQQIIDTVFNGERKPLAGWVAAKAVGDYQENACGEYCVYDKDKAQAKLKEAGGYTGTLTISYNADSGHKQWVEATCQSITNTLNIPCQGAPAVDFKTFLNALKKRETKGLYRYGWQMDYPLPENFLGPIYSKKAIADGSNYNDYDNPAFDKKLEEAAQAKSAADGAKLYFDAEKLLAENMPVVPLWGASARAGWSNKVTNVKIDAFGRPDYRNVKLK
ncbi:MAG: ABC transporter substrate-binding protein [Austwickia sp.]|jgi:oligopeptide transport system substrate-binding protein|nr:MAG: ABC transporter substrate-binding protein [Austwickia sp.]